MSTKAFKYRIYPTEEQRVLLTRTFGSCRYVYNHCLAKASKAYQDYKANNSLPKPQTNYYEFAKQLQKLKQTPEHLWLYETSSTALQQSLLRLGKAFSAFFKQKGKVGYPKFRSRYQRQSATLPTTGFRVRNNQLFIAKSTEPIQVAWSRELPSEPTSATITLDQSGHYYISFICQYQPVPTNGQSIIGIDLGIKTLATMSDSQIVSNPKHYIASQYKLTRLQRQLSHKTKGSSNRTKARVRLAKLHDHIANQRQDYLHKLTSKLVSKNQAICIENLNVAGMSKNSRLAKHILDASFGYIRQLLTYKVVDSAWCRLLIADRYYPSTQLCSHCGSKPKPKIKLGVDRWVCQSCGAIHARDDNASQNLEKLAIASKALWQDLPGKIVLLDKYQPSLT